MKQIGYVLLFGILIFTSCNREGKEGSIYLKIKENTFYKTLEYYDSNDQIPANNFVFDREYLCYAGTYDYFYRILLHDSSVLAFEGTYTLEADPGEDGGFMKSAKVGLDRHYVFKCDEEGGQFNYNYIRAHPNKAYQLSDEYIRFEDGFVMKVTRNVRLISP